MYTQDIAAVQTWMNPVLGNVSVTQTQYDMLCSLAFNIGQSNFTSSPAIAALIGNNLQKVPNLWMQHTMNGAGRIVPDLVVRRRAEVTRFMGAPSVETIGAGSTNLPSPGSTGNVAPRSTN